ncbi:transcriptional regulator [Virgibacillus pantothenticus]|uniref:Uncharacterized protein n=1 Tax=Virgibacillus pantothenticus TaxID=1473 RepID=A0A0L0QQ65_VIRPA|nr:MULTISPECIES: helix-turn-helix transcriptional regulator [Virgibacillus]API90743.1 transcriptional regulator [Virgibacillus sp. 6R]KNE20691.1 hypothetical protein AFK71_20345 [Virgibacillus pantothenticus]MBS7427656.1 helix-turn-helix transcriptional regulator [Virgibacillus sp. 19R1-5]MBU8566142.1 helix-turn-helix transcriptional regulator [Virgibacillus pantothenticus]MBU8600562.1 helix-turn-helix transcriptional regulator [Virgibacillus pantothenticus]
MLKNNVKHYRKKKKLTQKELGDNIGVSRQTINSIENEHYSPSISLVLKLAKVLEQPVEELFFLES